MNFFDSELVTENNYHQHLNFWSFILVQGVLFLIMILWKDELVFHVTTYNTEESNKG